MSDYNSLSATEKLRRAHAALVEPPLHCEVCGCAVQVGQLADHVAKRCPGPPAPGVSSRWITLAEVIRLGVPERTLFHWVHAGRIRSSGRAGRTRYLLRDIDRALAQRYRQQLRAGNALTKRRRKRHVTRMAKKLPAQTAKRLRSFADRAGSIAAAGRELNIPADTLTRALRGNPVRDGTRVLIEAQLQSRSVDD